MLHGVSSGGPVFGENKKVIGINSTGFENDDLSYISRIEDILDLQIRDVVMLNDTKTSTICLRDLIKINHVAI